MADVVRLTSHSRLLFSSHLLLPFRSNASTLKGPHKQQSPDDGRRGSAAPVFFTRRKSSPSFKVHATAVGKDDGPKWWERITGANMVDINSTEEFLSALNQAGDKLVIVEFYGTWCASCRALFPKLCKIAQEHPDILFLKVNFDENKPMCKDLNVKVLPYFHFYSGANGQLESFSCSLAKIQKIREAIERHHAAHSSITQPLGVGGNDFLGVSNPTGKPAEASSR